MNFFNYLIIFRFYKAKEFIAQELLANIYATGNTVWIFLLIIFSNIKNLCKRLSYCKTLFTYMMSSLSDKNEEILCRKFI